MYLIGLIDDEEKELKKIRRTIKTNAPQELNFDFKTYPLDGDVDTLIKKVSGEVIEDIKYNRISSLIIDYKIMIEAAKIEGTGIFEFIHELVPEFPVIILTDVIEECVRHDFVDPDKVYKKSDFFQIEEEYSKDKTINIFRNMERYVQRRQSLQIQLNTLKEELSQKGLQQKVFDDLIKVENQLDDFYPINQSQVEKVFDSNKIKEIVDLLEKADKLLEK